MLQHYYFNEEEYEDVAREGPMHVGLRSDDYEYDDHDLDVLSVPTIPNDNTTVEHNMNYRSSSNSIITNNKNKKNNNNNYNNNYKEDTSVVELEHGSMENPEKYSQELYDATWAEVFDVCCCHTPIEWFFLFGAFLVICFFLYFFLVGLELLGTSAKIIGGCTAGNLLGDNTNPIGALMIGILATVLLQSSSTTTSVIVSLVGSNVLGTKQAIFMVMGANIGTSVTNTIVAMGSAGNPDQLERAFAGATVHDLFNFLTVAILLPIEAATEYLYLITKNIVNEDSVRSGENWQGPIKVLVEPLGEMIINSNEKLLEQVAANETCEQFYPTNCTNPDQPTTNSCNFGLVGCSKSTNQCPAFFQVGATRTDDEISGGVCFFLAILVIVVCLAGLVTVLQRMLVGVAARIVFKATNINGYLAMLIGCGITLLVQSSSITTSTLTPLVGVGVLPLEKMYPLTLGANIGTTVTAILAALVSDKVDSLQVALAHLFFNLTGILIWYPIPIMRRIPINAAKDLGKTTRLWRGFPVVYILFMFFVMPLVLLGVATLFEQDAKGFDVLGSILVVILFAMVTSVVMWWKFRGGRENCLHCLQERTRREDALENVADDLEYLQEVVDILAEYTGFDDEYEARYIDEDDDEKDDDDDMMEPSSMDGNVQSTFFEEYDRR